MLTNREYDILYFNFTDIVRESQNKHLKELINNEFKAVKQNNISSNKDAELYDPMVVFFDVKLGDFLIRLKYKNNELYKIAFALKGKELLIFYGYAPDNFRRKRKLLFELLVEIGENAETILELINKYKGENHKYAKTF